MIASCCDCTMEKVNRIANAEKLFLFFIFSAFRDVYIQKWILKPNCIKSVTNSNWITSKITSPSSFLMLNFMRFNVWLQLHFNRSFRKRKLTSASAVSIIMVSRYNSHICPIQSWNMHVMSRSNYTIVSDASYSFNCTSHRDGFY